jgi:hypothetical protein
MVFQRVQLSTKEHLRGLLIIGSLVRAQQAEPFLAKISKGCRDAALFYAYQKDHVQRQIQQLIAKLGRQDIWGQISPRFAED